MTSDDFEDPTVPSQKVPDGSGDAPEERTVPSGNAGSEDVTAASTPEAGEDRTVPAMDANAMVGTEQLIGKTIGGCRIDRMLGRGAMGAVYKARQLKLDRDVAVKVIRPEMMTDARMLKRFEVEARTVGKFNSANVVMVHDVGFEMGVHYLVMEFVQGKNLREHVKLLAGGRLPAGEALPLIRQACKGLEEARRLHVVHRDIKPDNLMLTDQGVLKIADFGIAKPVEDEFNMTLTSELIGTPLYMSPEQCQGGADIDFRSDMYSLGATFFYLLTGEPPIRASSVYELIQTKTKLENLCLWKALPELDENHPLSRVIERMTANDRDDRYESYEELLNDLVLVEAGETIRTKVKRIKKANAEADRRDAREAADDGKQGAGVLVAVLALLVLGGGGGGYWWWQQQQKDPGQTSSNRVVGSTGDDAAVRLALDGIRSRLGETGPDAALAEELGKLAVPATLVRDAEQLRSDIDSGQQIAAALAELDRPAEPEVPFEDLERYFGSVREVSGRLPSAAGSELRGWLNQRNAEDRNELGQVAMRKLSNAWQGWQRERRGVTSDQEKLVELRERLPAIQQGRDRVYDMFADLRDDLNGSLSNADLAEAKRGLDQPAGPIGDVDAADRLVRLAKQFDELGPLDPIIKKVDAIQPATQADLTAQESLQLRLAAAKSKKDEIEKLDPPQARGAAELLDEVDRYYARIDRELKDLVPDEGSMPTWAQDLRRKSRDEDGITRQVQAAFRRDLQEWERIADSETEQALKQRKGRFEGALATAQRLFPEATGLPGDAQIRMLDASVKRAAAMARADKFGDELQGWVDAVVDVTDLELWAKKRALLQPARRDLRRQLGELEAAGINDRAWTTKLAGWTKKLERLDKDCERWISSTQAVKDAAGLFAAGDLKACGQKVQPEFEQLGTVADLCGEAFDALGNRADLVAARQKLDEAKEMAARTPIVADELGKKVDSWKALLQDFEKKIQGMVPIASAGAPAFFMAKTETSFGAYRAFIADVRQAATGTDGKPMLANVAARLPGVKMGDAQFLAMLNDVPRGGDDRPAERILWHEAMAFCSWNGLELPTEAEWKAAAYGPNLRGEKHTYSWGDEDRNTSRKEPYDVGSKEGGCWRHSDLRHLCGNVSEWLAAKDQNVVKVVGGSYRDGSRRTAKDLLKGEPKQENATRRKPGIGFRAVLRPRDFFGASWPKGGR